jgi:hypothetical protein
MLDHWLISAESLYEITTLQQPSNAYQKQAISTAPDTGRPWPKNQTTIFSINLSWLKGVIGCTS